MADFTLTPAAEQDLAGVWDYSFDTWSADQADRYLEKIESCCERIASGEALCRTFGEIDPRLKSHHCERHYIFFLATDEKPIVIAVLHERMDLLRRLKDRLE